MKVSSPVTASFLRLAALLFLFTTFAAPQACAQAAIKMLPPTNCTPAGTWHVLGWDAVSPLSCIPNFSFANNGYTGIGTAPSMPQALLELYGDDNFSYPTPGTAPLGNLHMYPTDNNDGYSEAITFGADGGQGNNDEAGIYVQYSTAFGTKMYFGTTNNYGVGSQIHMMMDQNGYVGINTTTPGTMLDVNGSEFVGGGVANLDYSGGPVPNLAGSNKLVIGWNRTRGMGEADFIQNRYGAVGTTGGFNFYDYGNDNSQKLLVTIYSNGNVGIGIPAPVAPLDVAGGMRGSGASVVAGGGCSPEGMFGYDLTNHKPVYCNGSIWISLWSAPPTVTSMIAYSNETVGPFSYCAWSGGNAGNNYIGGIYPISGGPGAYMWSINVSAGPQRIDCF
jgi:hypothetical protein